MFKASKSLLIHGNGSIFPPCANDQDLANEFGDFFVQKILDIKSAIISTSHQSPNALPVESVTDVSFPEFNLLSKSEVRATILSSKKSCPLDPIPITILVKHLDELLPSVTRIINLSLDTGYFPDHWKLALVRPLLKKDGLVPVLKHYRPVSNLKYISKLVETVVARQLQKYLSSNNLFPE